MTLFLTLTKNGSKDFSDFVYGVRGDDYLTSCENRMSGKIQTIQNHILHTNPKKKLFKVTFIIPQHQINH